MENANKELELRRRCLVRGWKINNFTLFLLESGYNCCELAELMGANRCTLQHWLTNDLSASVNFTFLMIRKLRMHDIDVFAYI